MFLIFFLNMSNQNAKVQVFFCKAFSSANKKLIFEKIRFLKKNLKSEKQLYITIFLMDCHQYMFNQN